MIFAGLMSGTSLDAMDVALIEVSPSADAANPYQINTDFAGVSINYNHKDRAILMQAVSDALKWQFDGPKPKSFVPASQVVTKAAYEAVNQCLEHNKVKSRDIAAIGFHGQTVLHRPPAMAVCGQTLQIGDPQKLAENTGCKIVHDFRRADMLAGGHGAPLAPAWHFQLARQRGVVSTAFVNIGGVSNITFIPQIIDEEAQAQMIAFDCGPGNGPLDAWIHENRLDTMDRGGRYSAKGVIAPSIVEAVLPTLPLAGQPTSLDRWAFSHESVRGLPIEDGAATLVEITAQGIARGISSLPVSVNEVLIGGGGRHNPVLMGRLGELIDLPLHPCEEAGFSGDLIEAQAFAWLACLKLNKRAGSWPGTTGVPQPMVCGSICEISSLT